MPFPSLVHDVEFFPIPTGQNPPNMQSPSFTLEPKAQHAVQLIVNCTGQFSLSASSKHSPKDTDPLPVRLDWTLSDPDARVIFSFQAPASGSFAQGQVAIVQAMLDSVRDAAGYSDRPWTLTFTNPTSVVYEDVLVRATIEETVESISAPPLLVISSASPLTLREQGQIFDLGRINRLGTLQVTFDNQVVAVGTVPVTIDVRLIFPDGTVAATGINGLTHQIGQRELYQMQKVGKAWQLVVGGRDGATCSFTVQIFNTLNVPLPVLQERIAAITGPDNDSIAITFQHDGDDNNYVCLAINTYSTLTTLDTLGYLTQLELQDLILRGVKDASGNSIDKTKDRYFDNPGWITPVLRYPYRILDLGKFDDQVGPFDIIAHLEGFLSNSLSITLAATEGTRPSVSVDITFPGNPQVTLDDGVPDVGLTDVSFHLEMAFAVGPDGTVTLELLTPADQALTFNASGVVAGKVRTQIQSRVSTALASFGAHLAPTIQQLFFTVMGGRFTFTSCAFFEGAFQFGYIPAEEEPQGGLNSNYIPASHVLASAPVAGAPPVEARIAAPVVVSRNSPNWSSPNLSKIDHIVVLMKENRSFDHVLGYLSLTANRTDVDGLTPAVLAAFSGNSRPLPYPLASEPGLDHFPFDPDHSYGGTLAQIMANGSQGPMRGFVEQFEVDYPFVTWTQDRKAAEKIDQKFWPFNEGAIMGYHTPKTVPFYDTLASQYMVCNRWFSSHPGPTFPNRFFYLMGHLDTDRFGEAQLDNNQSALTLLRHRSIFDALTERGVDWRVYEGDPGITMLRTFARYAFDDTNIRPMAEFAAAARAGELPAFTMIDPNFHVGQTNDDHPPTSITFGQTMVQDIYEALVSNAAAWSKTLFVIIYDEHGGTYDHVPPPLAGTYTGRGVPSVNINYGVRIPAFIVSPWVPVKASTSTIFDHTSVLKTVIARFCPDDPAILSDRVAWANDLGPLLSLPAPLLERGPIASAPTTVAEPAKPANGVAAAAATQPAPSRAATLLTKKADAHEYMDRLQQLVRP